MAGLDAKRGDMPDSVRRHPLRRFGTIEAARSDRVNAEADGGMRFRHHFIPLIFFDFRVAAAARFLDGTKTVPEKTQALMVVILRGVVSSRDLVANTVGNI